MEWMFWAVGFVFWMLVSYKIGFKRGKDWWWEEHCCNEPEEEETNGRG